MSHLEFESRDLCVWWRPSLTGKVAGVHELSRSLVRLQADRRMEGERENKIIIFFKSFDLKRNDLIHSKVYSILLLAAPVETAAILELASQPASLHPSRD